jgi:hypothetical protein
MRWIALDANHVHWASPQQVWTLTQRCSSRVDRRHRTFCESVRHVLEHWHSEDIPRFNANRRGVLDQTTENGIPNSCGRFVTRWRDLKLFTQTVVVSDGSKPMLDGQILP